MASNVSAAGEIDDVVATLQRGIERDESWIVEYSGRVARARAMNANENDGTGDGQKGAAPSPLQGTLRGSPAQTSGHRDIIDLTSDDEDA